MQINLDDSQLIYDPSDIERIVFHIKFLKEKRITSIIIFWNEF